MPGMSAPSRHLWQMWVDLILCPGQGTEGWDGDAETFGPILAPFWAHFGPGQGRDAQGVSMLLSNMLQPARPPACAGHVSPRCHPPRSLEENNYYANLNESRPQPTTGNINIKVRASIESRGRTVINSITNRCPASTKSRAETHRGEDRYGCARAPGWNWGAGPHPVRAVPCRRTRLCVSGSWLPAQN